jgi:D-aminoacyl-tRNA deacylase
MIAIVQRVTNASVVVDGRTTGEITEGLLALVAVENGDGEAQIEWMSRKLLGLRVFRDGDKHFDKDLSEISGGILLVSNFTVAAETRKGRRPSLDNAAAPGVAGETFARFVERVRRDAGDAVNVQTGVFGGDMKVSLTNDGPATFIVRTDQKSS